MGKRSDGSRGRFRAAGFVCARWRLTSRTFHEWRRILGTATRSRISNSLTAAPDSVARARLVPAARRISGASSSRPPTIRRVIQEYFRDGRLSEQLTQVKSALSRTITYLDPDLILTCDAAGLDGHSDHVACSVAVTEMRRLMLPLVALWYVALPVWPLTVAPHLGKMARDPHVDARPLTPTHRVFIGSAIGAKIRASYAHRSQRAAKRKGLDRLVPPWILVSLLPFEYFTEA